jgi:predicted metal-dependent phosphoesterase TrpH
VPLSPTNLRLAPTAVIDLQLHTTHSDGDWADEQLLDYLVAEGFGLAAVTDHDRADTAPRLQTLAAEKGLPLLTAVEMSATWQGKLTDLLCYGFDPDNNHLDALAQDTAYRQRENSRQVFNHLLSQGHPLDPQALDRMLAQPAARQLPELLALAATIMQDKKAIGRTLGRTLLDGGFSYMTHDPAVIVAAAQRSGAVCILAHPGRTDGFVCYDPALLDELRREAPIDGIEVYYPMHTPEQTASYREYAQRRNLLISAGSDSHSPDQPPIKYPAELCRALLERLGVQIA